MFFFNLQPMKYWDELVQSKELEQAKIALEEARLEVAALRHQQEPGSAPQALQQQQWSVRDLMFGGVDEEINGLRARLRAASQAEERSRKAADDLTAALSAVNMEARQVKAWLSDAQAELEAANAEVQLDSAAGEVGVRGWASPPPLLIRRGLPSLLLQRWPTSELEREGRGGKCELGECKMEGLLVAPF